MCKLFFLEAIILVPRCLSVITTAFEFTSTGCLENIPDLSSTTFQKQKDSFD